MQYKPLMGCVFFKFNIISLIFNLIISDQHYVWNANTRMMGYIAWLVSIWYFMGYIECPLYSIDSG